MIGLEPKFTPNSGIRTLQIGSSLFHGPAMTSIDFRDRSRLACILVLHRDARTHPLLPHIGRQRQHDVAVPRPGCFLEENRDQRPVDGCGRPGHAGLDRRSAARIDSVTLSDGEGQGERAPTRRSGRMSARYRSRHWMYRFGPSALGLASPARSMWSAPPRPQGRSMRGGRADGLGGHVHLHCMHRRPVAPDGRPPRKQCEGASRGPGGGTSGPAGSRAGALVLLA